MASIIDGLFPAQVAAESRMEIGRESVKIDTNVDVFSFRWFLSRENEDVQKFVFWCVRPPTSAESARFPIVHPINGRTVGYVFPLSSFDPSSPFCPQKNENGYIQAYASAALLWVAREGGANEHLRGADLSWAADLSVADLFNPDLSVVVIGKEVVDEELLGVVRLSLETRGFFVADGSGSAFERFRLFDSTKIKLDLFGSAISRHISSIEKFLMLASRQDTPAASFLFYYQVVELLSDKALDRLMRKAVSKVDSASGYEIKSKVLEYTSESVRVERLVDFAKGVAASSVETFRLAAVSLLAFRSGYDLETKAAKALYDLRNFIVHNQDALGGVEPAKFRPVIDGLHLTVVAMIKGFPSVPHASLDPVDELEDVRQLRRRIDVARARFEEDLRWFDRRRADPSASMLEAQVAESEAALRRLEATLEELLRIYA